MRGWLERMNWKMERWMQGRHGQDELNQCLSILALILLLLSFVSGIFGIFALAVLVWTQFRCCSKKLEKRERERQAYLRLVAKTKDFISLQKRRRADRKTHRYYKCTNCKTILRVPRGKGKIEITCPRCHTINIHTT